MVEAGEQAKGLAGARWEAERKERRDRNRRKTENGAAGAHGWQQGRFRVAVGQWLSSQGSKVQPGSMGWRWHMGVRGRIKKRETRKRKKMVAWQKLAGGGRAVLGE